MPEPVPKKALDSKWEQGLIGAKGVVAEVSTGVVDVEASSLDLLCGRGLTSSTAGCLSLLEVRSKLITGGTPSRDPWGSLCGTSVQSP